MNGKFWPIPKILTTGYERHVLQSGSISLPGNGNFQDQGELRVEYISAGVLSLCDISFATSDNINVRVQDLPEVEIQTLNVRFGEELPFSAFLYWRHQPPLPRGQSGTTAVRTRASPPVPLLLPRVPHSRAFRTPGHSAPKPAPCPTEADYGGSSVEVRSPERDNSMNSFGNSVKLSQKLHQKFGRGSV